MKNELPSFDVLHELFQIIDGVLCHKIRGRNWFSSDTQYKVWNKRFSGKKAGSINTSGHVQVKINDSAYLAHRIVWVMHNGLISVEIEIDHFNEIKTDNRIENLRLATGFQNRCNTKQKINNKSGVKGVYWCDHFKKWVAQVKVDGKSASKKFDDKMLAASWVEYKRIELHGKFANHGNGCVNGTGKTRSRSPT